MTLFSNNRLLPMWLVLFLLGLTTDTIAGSSPDFTLPTDKGEVTLSQFKGKVVYLDFWASWCPPCRKSFPWMNEMQARYGEEGFVVLAVSIDKDRNDVKKFLETTPANFHIAYDQDGVVSDQYEAVVMPTSYILDRYGDIQMIHTGFSERDKAILESNINTWLNFDM